MDTLPSFTYQRFDSRTDARSAFDTVIETAQRQIRLYDRDGYFYGLDRPVVAEHFGRLLLRSPQTSIRIVLQQTHLLRHNCPRLMALMQRHGSQFEVRRLDEKYRGYERGLLLADDAVVMRRPHFEQNLAFWDVGEAEISNAVSLFTELWDHNPEVVSASVTGL